MIYLDPTALGLELSVTMAEARELLSRTTEKPKETAMRPLVALRLVQEASNGLSAAGGVGSGSNEGSVVQGVSFLTDDGGVDTRPNEFTSSGAVSGAFDSLGQGIAGVQGGSASGKSNSGGTASNTGSATIGYLNSDGSNDPLNLLAAGSGMFVSNAGSSGVGQSMLGSAVGSGTAGANGSTDGGGETEIYGGINQPTGFNVAGVVESVGSGEFAAVFSANPTKPTGGSGSGNGSLNVVLSAAGNLDADVAEVQTGATSTGAAANFGGGAGVGSTALGSAGSIGSGESSGSAATGGSAGPVTVGAVPAADPIVESFMGVGSATSGFAGAGESFFGGSSLALQFP